MQMHRRQKKKWRMKNDERPAENWYKIKAKPVKVWDMQGYLYLYFIKYDSGWIIMK